MKYILLLTLSLFICISAHAEERYLLSDEYRTCIEIACYARDNRVRIGECYDKEYNRLTMILNNTLKKIIEVLYEKGDHESIRRLKDTQISWKYYSHMDKEYLNGELGIWWGFAAGEWALYITTERIIDLKNILNEKPLNSNLIETYRYTEDIEAGFPSPNFIDCMEAGGSNFAVLLSCAERESKIQEDLLDRAYEDKREELRELAAEAPDSLYCLYRHPDFVQAQQAWDGYFTFVMIFYNGLDRPDAKLRGMVWGIYANARRACQIKNINNFDCYTSF